MTSLARRNERRSRNCSAPLPSRMRPALCEKQLRDRDACDVRVQALYETAGRVVEPELALLARSLNIPAAVKLLD
jgi:hypothetical protein